MTLDIAGKEIELKCAYQKQRQFSATSDIYLHPKEIDWHNNPNFRHFKIICTYRISCKILNELLNWKLTISWNGADNGHMLNVVINKRCQKL